MCLVVEAPVVTPQERLFAAGCIQAGHKCIALELHVDGHQERTPASLVLRERQALVVHAEGDAASLARRELQQRIEEADEQHLSLEGRRPGGEHAVRGFRSHAQGHGDLQGPLGRGRNLAQVLVRLVLEEEDEVARQLVDRPPVAVAVQAVLAAVRLARLDHDVEHLAVLLRSAEGALHAVALHLAHLQAAAERLVQRELDFDLQVR
mmetsp:Transcript_108305/g.316824  ORF Transcript_108305/g.316824 Transcript_108305/m.316824 type:complete len:207 (-) Transcript_108305:707-1327(-)